MPGQGWENEGLGHITHARWLPEQNWGQLTDSKLQSPASFRGWEWELIGSLWNKFEVNGLN